jgi:hypothetical protein
VSAAARIARNLNLSQIGLEPAAIWWMAARDISSTDLMACVWEMGVQARERQAWNERVLADPAGPDLDAYDQR